jgi:hypothetical protein
MPRLPYSFSDAVASVSASGVAAFEARYFLL